MGFWSSVGKTLTQSSEILAESAKGFEQLTANIKEEAIRFKLEQQIINSEKARLKVGAEWFSVLNYEKQKELTNAYEELILDYPNQLTNSAKQQFQQLQLDQRLAHVTEEVQKVECLEKYLLETKYKLPIDKINAINTLLNRINALSIKCLETHHNMLIKKLACKTELLESDIEKLEQQRGVIREKHDPITGEREIRNVLDGKLDGFTERYYFKEFKRLQVSFSKGVVLGTIKYWNRNGTLLMEAESHGNKSVSFHFCSLANVQVFEGTVKNQLMTIQILMPSVKKIEMEFELKNSGLKLQLFLYMLFKPGLWWLCWSARNNQKLKSAFLELNEMAKIFETTMSEIELIRVAG
jgi:antitoxin component YwqK of YwqJK toxin-antitoxin module